ncbi:hypothetical protein ACIPD2_36880 [Streptomyces griseofuscus]|uniref:hypothetical protein n=1 Tax=Streptomyces griseofuscus TaxID=146922 RepID=UPI003820C295
MTGYGLRDSVRDLTESGGVLASHAGGNVCRGRLSVRCWGVVAAIVGLFLSEEDARHLFSRFARWDSRY